MDALMIPGVQAILSVATISWICSFSISLLALVFVTGSSLKHYKPEINAVVGLLCLAMLTVHVSTGRWMLF